MANLKAAVQWIALNDNAGEKDTVEDTAGYLTVALVADIFGKDTTEVARKVVYWRKQFYKEMHQ